MLVYARDILMVPGGRFELPTRGFSVRCSTPELPGHNSLDTPTRIICPILIGLN